MTKFVERQNRKWEQSQVVGKQISRCWLWNEGNNVSASIASFSKGESLGYHRHDTWVQVLVLSGKFQVNDKVVGAGDYYFVEEGDEHLEVALEPTEVLIIRAEPNISYPVNRNT